MVFVLRRYTAPPRRIGGVACRIRQLPASPVPRPVPESLPPQDNFNAPLYTFKAFAIATAVVVTTASASVAGVMAYLGVRDTTEFTAYMRTWVSQSMPLLTAKIYRRPTPRDSVPNDPVLLAAQLESPPQTTFDHDASQQRLADAFDKGGFQTWAETAAKELEAEIEIERARNLTAS